MNAAVHRDIPDTGNCAMVGSSTVQDETGASIKGESTDVGNCVKNITSTGKLETGATEHHSVQETGIPIENSLHADSAKNPNRTQWLL